MIDALKQKKMYVKLLAFFVGLAAAIVLALSIAFQSIYRDALLKEMYSTYENELQNRSIEIEKLVEEIDYAYLSILGNPEVESFVAMDSWNPMDEHDVKQQFSRFRNIHSKIHSVYLYNGTLGYVVTTDAAGENLAEFADKKVFEGVDEYRQIKVRELPGEMGAEQVMSFIYGQFDEERQLKSCIVINVTSLAELGMLGQADLSATVLLDREKGLLTSNREDIPQGEVLWEKVQEGSGGYIGRDDQGKRYVVGYYPVSSLNWTLVSLHDYGAVMGRIQSQTSVILYLSLGVLLVSGAAVVFLSRNLYLPIERFVRKVGRADLSVKDSRQRKNELDYLMDSFSEMMERVNQTQRSHERIVADGQKEFYRQILLHAQEGEELHTQAQHYGVNLERAWFSTFAVKLDQYYTVPPEHHSLHKTAVWQIVVGQLEDQFEAVVVTMPGGTTAAILFGDEPMEEEDLVKVFQSICSLVEKTLGQSVTIGLGHSVEDISEVYASYEEALSLTEWRLTMGYGKIFTENRLPSVERAHYPDDLEKQLLESLHLERQKEYSAAADQLLERLRRYDPDSAKLYLTQVLLVMANSVNQVEGKSRMSIGLGKLAEFLSGIETLNQATEWFQIYYQEYRTLVKEASLRKNSKKLENIIQQAKTYLEENCKDPSLSVEMVATHFGYTSNYFAKIFKESTGQFINDYIRKCRIDRAKTFLAETDLTVSEVAELTGYYNTNYFFYAFKKTTGVTPASYRAGIKEKL